MYINTLYIYIYIYIYISQYMHLHLSCSAFPRPREGLRQTLAAKTVRRFQPEVKKTGWIWLDDAMIPCDLALILDGQSPFSAG